MLGKQLLMFEAASCSLKQLTDVWGSKLLPQTVN